MMINYWSELLEKIDAEPPRVTLTIDDIDEMMSMKHRHVCLFELVDRDSASEVANAILEFNSMDNGLPPENRKPIKLFISSPGGDILEGLRIIDAITTSKTPVHTIVVGTAYSMAFEIAIAGHKRFATPFASFLIHDGSVVVYNSASKSNDEAKFNTERNEREQKFILEHTKIPEKQLKEMERVEWYMFADRALELGVIDEIVTDISTVL